MQKHHIFRRASATELFIGRFASDDVKRVQVVTGSPDTTHDDEMESQPGQHIDVVNSASSSTVGEWVLVRYGESMFPGEVKEIGMADLKVSVMVPFGATYYKWPASEDCIFYNMNNVIMKLKAPILKSSRGTYEFLEKW